jgi:predicted transposase YdaD
VVVFPSRAVDTGRTEAYAGLLEQGQVQRVYLDELISAEDDGWQMALLRLTVAPESQAADLARRIIDQTHTVVPRLNRLLILDLIEMILVYKLPQMTREEIREMLHLPDIELQQTRFYQDVFFEGRQEGRLQGRAEGESALVLRLLCRTVGPLSAAQESQIRKLSLEKIEALGEALLDFQSPDDLGRWLSEFA